MMKGVCSYKKEVLSTKWNLDCRGQRLRWNWKDAEIAGCVISFISASTFLELQVCPTTVDWYLINQTRVNIMSTINICNKTKNILEALGENYFRANFVLFKNHFVLALVKWVQVKLNTRKIPKTKPNSNIRKWGRGWMRTRCATKLVYRLPKDNEYLISHRVYR